MLDLPKGAATNHDGRQEHGTPRRRTGGMHVRAVTADVALANIVKCSGTMCQTWRVKCKA